MADSWARSCCRYPPQLLQLGGIVLPHVRAARVLAAPTCRPAPARAGPQLGLPATPAMTPGDRTEDADRRAAWLARSAAMTRVVRAAGAASFSGRTIFPDGVVRVSPWVRRTGL